MDNILCALPSKQKNFKRLLVQGGLMVFFETFWLLVVPVAATLLYYGLTF